MALPRQSSRFDERRNTSRVFPVEPGALAAAAGALAAFKREQPALYAWVAEGAPRLSEDDHLHRFGEAYAGVKRARSARGR